MLIQNEWTYDNLLAVPLFAGLPTGGAWPDCSPPALSSVGSRNVRGSDLTGSWVLSSG